MQSDVLAHRTDRTLVIDARGRRIIPGLNDSHIHMIRGGLNFNLELRWDGVPSLADASSAVEGTGRRTPPPQWVRVVGGWSEFQFAERRMPTLRGDQRGGTGYAGLRPASLRSRLAERRGASRRRVSPRTRRTRRVA